jgi:hypothetical protein
MPSFLNKLPPRQPGDVADQLAQIKSAGLNTIGSSTQGLPKVVSNIAIRKKIISTTQVQLTISFTMNPNDVFFTTAKIYLRLGTANPVVVGEGALSPLTVTVTRTHTPATFFVQSVGNWGSTPLSTSPAQSVSLA